MTDAEAGEGAALSAAQARGILIYEYERAKEQGHSDSGAVTACWELNTHTGEGASLHSTQSANRT